MMADEEGRGRRRALAANRLVKTGLLVGRHILRRFAPVVQLLVF